MEIAYKQNHQLMSAYRARMTRMNKRDPGAFNLVSALPERERGEGGREGRGREGEMSDLKFDSFVGLHTCCLVCLKM